MSGSKADDTRGDDLEANRFQIDIPDELLEAATADEVTDELIDEVTDDDLPDDLLRQAEADHYAELVAKQWGTPEGEWWP
jgi:hypothetical protein